METAASSSIAPFIGITTSDEYDKGTPYNSVELNAGNPNMKILSIKAYRNLIEGSEPLASEFVNGVISHKVFRLSDQSMLKLFRIKRLFSSARLFPRTKRFQRNVDYLSACGIPTMDVAAVYNIPEIKRTAVHYHPLLGITLRDHCQTTAIDSSLSGRLGFFLHFLHQHGIYFRSIHFDNIVLTTDDQIGLIDVVDMRVLNTPLNLTRRIRNLRHLFRYHSDAVCLAPERKTFQDAYCRSAQLPPRQESRFRRHFESYF